MKISFDYQQIKARELLQNGICTIAEFYNSSLAFTFRYPEVF